MSNFSEALEKFRKGRGLTKQELAERAGLTASYISHLTRGSRAAPSQEAVVKLAEALKLEDEEKRYLFHSAGLSLPSISLSIISSTVIHHDGQSSTTTEIWGDAANTQDFYGREDELQLLRRWVLDDQSQLVVISGVGGIGKTLTATRLARDIAGEFNYVFWHSLKDAPSLESTLKSFFTLFSSQPQFLNVDEQMRLLMRHLREHRCLLILDNFESLLQEDRPTGEYRKEYEDYGRLIDMIGKTQHQSCLVLTTREAPDSIALLAGERSPVHAYQLKGLKAEDCLKILQNKGLRVIEKVEALIELVQRYGGNPLALKVAAEFIRDVFAGDIPAFLASQNLIFKDIQNVLDQQFERLSSLEQEIMYWLAIEREAVTFKDLQQELVHAVEVQDLLEALKSLVNRSLIEKDQYASYTLQQVIQEFVTEKLVKRAIDEIAEGTIDLVSSHALIKAQAKEYIREIQIRYILQPIGQKLQNAYGTSGCEEKLKNVLNRLHEASTLGPSYAAGNILNLLVHLEYDLTGLNFSHLAVWQAYLRGTSLPHVDFSYADLKWSVFLDTFSSILSVALSPGPDNYLLAAGTENGEVRLWDARSGAPLRTYYGHTGRVRSVAFSPDGQMLASGSEDYTLRLWSIDTDQCLQVFQGHKDRVRAVAMDPKGRMVISGSDDCMIRIWNTETGECTKVLRGHTNRVRAVVVSSDGTFIASGGEDNTVRLWDMQSGECIKTLDGHERQVHAVNFSPDSTQIVSGGEDHTVRIWEVQSGACLKILRGHTNQVRSAVFSPVGDKVVSGSDDRTIRIWNAQSGECVATLEDHLHRVYTAVFSYDGSTIVSGSEDQTIRIWDVQTGKCLNTLQGYINQVRSVAFDLCGKTLASGGDDHQIRLWNVESDHSFKTLAGHTHGIRAVSFSSDGMRFASASDDLTIRIWDAQAGRCLKVLREHTDRVRTVAFSPDDPAHSPRLASGGEDHTVRIWDAQTGQRLKVLGGHTDWVRTVAFSPDGKLLASGSEDQTIRIWNVESGQHLKTLNGHTNGVRSVAFSPDGKLLASGSDDKTIRIWETANWNPCTTFPEDTRWVLSVAFSPDGRYIASGGEDQTIKLWEIASGQCLKVLRGHTHRIYSVAFHPDGHLLASGSLDGTIRLWDVNTNECLKTLANNKPYEGMNITHAQGLTETQPAILMALGAREEV